MATCSFDSECLVMQPICLQGSCVARCVDSDGAALAPGAALGPQTTTPGQVTAYQLHAGAKGALLWSKVAMVDGCKSNTMLLEYLCRDAPKAAQPAPHLDFQYVACPADYTCQGSTDPTSGVYAATCLPKPASSTPCVSTAWSPVGLVNYPVDVYTLGVLGPTLCAGGLGGLRCLATNGLTWQETNAGLPTPAWLDLPLVVSMAESSQHQWLVMLNAPEPLVQVRAIGTSVWQPAVATPAGAQRLLAVGPSLYVAGEDGVHVRQPSSELWVPMGAAIGEVRALYHDGDLLFAGTAAGGLWWFESWSNTWFPATADFAAPVRSIHYSGDYLYVGTDLGLQRCWSEAPLWGIETYCEAIEPETGLNSLALPEALHVHNGQLQLATSLGVFQFEAMKDFWTPMNAGLMNAETSAPWLARTLATFQGQLLAGTSGGVFRYGCQ